MKVLYDYQVFLWPDHGGIPRYFTELIREFRESKDVEPIIPAVYYQNKDYRSLIFSEENNLPFSWKVRDSLLSYSRNLIHKNPAKYFTSAEKKCKTLLMSGDVDVFHPTHFSTYYQNLKIKAPIVLTVHDLTVEKYIEFGPISKCAELIRNTAELLKSASRIICISEYTKNELLKYYDVESSIIDVVYHGSFFEKYNIPQKKNDYPKPAEPYLLYVNGRSPHKNFYHFVESVAPILLSENLKLICAGGRGFHNDERRFLNALGIEGLVIQKSVNDRELIQLYQNALAFVFPSINEGFGLPLLEAMSCGTPIICSNTSSLPEIAGEAAEYFNPKDPGSIRNALCKVIENESLRKKMRNIGYNQLKKFSCKKCADETKIVYEKAME